MNPFDALLLPPALLKRALDDINDIAQLARRYASMEEEILARVQLLERDIAQMRSGVDRLHGELADARIIELP